MVAAVRKAAYKLELPLSLKGLHPVFPVVKLLQVPPDPFLSCRQPPPPDPIIVDDAEHFELDEILDSRIRYCRIEYLVKWKGYNDSHNQWIPWYNLDTGELSANSMNNSQISHPLVPLPANSYSVSPTPNPKWDQPTPSPREGPT